jgi:hypothetical protein
MTHILSALRIHHLQTELWKAEEKLEMTSWEAFVNYHYPLKPQIHVKDILKCCCYPTCYVINGEELLVPRPNPQAGNHLAQERNKWRVLALVNAVMNLRVPWNAGNFLTSWKPVSFSKRTPLHGVSCYPTAVTNGKFSRTCCRGALPPPSGTTLPLKWRHQHNRKVSNHSYLSVDVT